MHQLRVDWQWLTACCDMGRVTSGQAAVCASGCGSERDHHLARRRGDAEAPGECQGDGLEKIQPLGRSLEHTSAPAPTSPLVGRGRHIWGASKRRLVVAHTSCRFSCAHTGRWPVHSFSRSARRPRAIEHGRSPTAFHAFLNKMKWFCTNHSRN